MTTMSQLVDSIISESLRPDLRAAIEQYINLTVLELHQDKSSEGVILYGANRKEALVEPTLDASHVWAIPRPQLFQMLDSVWYGYRGIVPKERSPGLAVAMSGDVDGFAYYYRTGDAYAFAGFGGIGSPIALSWFERVPRLKWQKPVDRLVTWDEEEQVWVWKAGVNPAEHEAILYKSSHWLLLRYQDVLNAGAKAKLYVRVGDTDRARLHYSLYENLRNGLKTTETATAVARISR